MTSHAMQASSPLVAVHLTNSEWTDTPVGSGNRLSCCSTATQTTNYIALTTQINIMTKILVYEHVTWLFNHFACLKNSHGL